MAAPAETIRGTVQRSSASGVLLEDRTSWLTYSKFAKPGAIPTLEGGDRVELSIDGKGFVRTAVILNVEQPFNSHGTASAGGMAPHVPRNVQTIRECCIKSAATFCAARLDLKSADLFALAERMEGWITREA